ncbi:MAG: RimJ/RimL family protein N-acetyltransferase [Candidatus Azotimanducaceae bacterium]|jgi:RimJ/RimL family protein N-acetyltransferase
MLGTKIDQSNWAFPEKTTLQGQYVTLEPLSLNHLSDLWAEAKSAPDSFSYLRYGPFETADTLRVLLTDLSSRTDQPFWAVIDSTGSARGWLSICDVDQDAGAFEIGSIWFAPVLQGTREGREAIFLLMCLGMDTHKYERLVWRCQTQNAPSFKAAINLGFQHEGTWRNAAILDGWQRDISWFSILKAEWPVSRDAFISWLSATNFDNNGHQKTKLQDLPK